MSIEWNLLQLLIAGAALILGAANLVSLIRLNRNLQTRIAETESKLSEIQQRLELGLAHGQLLETRIQTLEQTAERVSHLPLASSGLSLNKKALALRMHRRGESASHIASVLALPQGEVDLLLKLYKLEAAVEPPSSSSLHSPGQS